MHKPLELYVALIITVLFVVFLPTVVKKKGYEIVERNKTEYELERIVWELETGDGKTSAYNLPEGTTLTPYTEYKTAIDMDYDTSTNFYQVPNGTKYLKIQNDKMVYWIVYPKATAH